MDEAPRAVYEAFEQSAVTQVDAFDLDELRLEIEELERLLVQSGAFSYSRTHHVA